jgi:hypothetical protein
LLGDQPGNKLTTTSNLWTGNLWVGSSLAVVLALLAGCAGGAGLSNQIVVSRDEDPYNFDAAQREADQICISRGGGHARFVIWLNNAAGAHERAGPPNAIFDCQPAG